MKKAEFINDENSTCVFFTSEINITQKYEDKIYSESYKTKNYNIFQDENEVKIFLTKSRFV